MTIKIVNTYSKYSHFLSASIYQTWIKCNLEYEQSVKCNIISSFSTWYIAYQMQFGIIIYEHKICGLHNILQNEHSISDLIKCKLEHEITDNCSLFCLNFQLDLISKLKYHLE